MVQIMGVFAGVARGLVRARARAGPAAGRAQKDSGKSVVGGSALKRTIDEAALTVADETGVAPQQPWTLHEIRRSVRTRRSAIDVPDVVKELGIARAIGGAVPQA